MENIKNTFKERINGMTYVVNVGPSKDAKITKEELLKKLLAEKTAKIKPETA